MRPNTLRAQTAENLIWMVMVFALLAMASDFMELNLLRNIENVSPEEATASDSRQLMIVIIFSIAYLISGIYFIRWFRRAYYNQQVKFTSMKYTNGWAAGSWFIPIFNLFRPYQMIQEMFNNAYNALEYDSSDRKVIFNNRLLGFWWFMWVAFSILSRVQTRASKIAEDIGALTKLNYFSIGLNLWIIPMAFLVVKVIRNYNEMEEQMIVDYERERKQILDKSSEAVIINTEEISEKIDKTIPTSFADNESSEISEERD